MVTVAFIWCFSCFNWFSYCRGNCICAGQGNTIISHFVVQRGDFTVAIACVPCGLRRSLIYACEWGFWVCWKLSAAEQVKPDCRHMPAVVSTLLTPLPVSCPLTTPLHYTTKRFYCYITHWKQTYRVKSRETPKLWTVLAGLVWSWCESLPVLWAVGQSWEMASAPK